jgi:5-methylcytosine-specific restriction endonuclease McrA
MRQWRSENRDLVARADAARHARDRDKRNTRSRARKRRERAANPERARQLSRRYAAEREARRQKARSGNPTLAAEYMEIVLADPCAYCGGASAHIDHIEPLAQGGEHGWDNFTAACANCNKRKHTKPLLAFLRGR